MKKTEQTTVEESDLKSLQKLQQKYGTDMMLKLLLGELGVEYCSKKEVEEIVNKDIIRPTVREEVNSLKNLVQVKPEEQDNEIVNLNKLGKEQLQADSKKNANLKEDRVEIVKSVVGDEGCNGNEYQQQGTDVILRYSASETALFSGWFGSSVSPTNVDTKSKTLTVEDKKKSGENDSTLLLVGFGALSIQKDTLTGEDRKKSEIEDNGDNNLKKEWLNCINGLDNLDCDNIDKETLLRYIALMTLSSINNKTVVIPSEWHGRFDGKIEQLRSGFTGEHRRYVPFIDKAFYARYVPFIDKAFSRLATKKYVKYEYFKKYSNFTHKKIGHKPAYEPQKNIKNWKKQLEGIVGFPWEDSALAGVYYSHADNNLSTKRQYNRAPLPSTYNRAPLSPRDPYSGSNTDWLCNMTNFDDDCSIPASVRNARQNRDSFSEHYNQI